MIKKNQARCYKIHYLLKKKGHEVRTKERTVTMKSQPSAIEKKYMSELVAFGYCVSIDMFA